jgi:hypothetical protein
LKQIFIVAKDIFFFKTVDLPPFKKQAPSDLIHFKAAAELKRPNIFYGKVVWGHLSFMVLTTTPHGGGEFFHPREKKLFSKAVLRILAPIFELMRNLQLQIDSNTFTPCT